MVRRRSRLRRSDYGAVLARRALRIAQTAAPIRGCTALALAGGVAGALLILNGARPSPDGPATPTFRGKNSPLPEEPPAAT